MKKSSLETIRYNGFAVYRSGEFLKFVKGVEPPDFFDELIDYFESGKSGVICPAIMKIEVDTSTIVDRTDYEGGSCLTKARNWWKKLRRTSDKTG